MSITPRIDRLFVLKEDHSASWRMTIKGVNLIVKILQEYDDYGP